MKKTAVVWVLLVGVLHLGVVAQSSKPVSSRSADYVRLRPVEPLAAGAMQALNRITASALAAHIGFLSSPAMEGRGLGSRGLEAAAEYVAATLAVSGVSAANGAGNAARAAAYFQPVPLREISRASGQLLIETRRGPSVEAQRFDAGVDCLFPELAPETFAAPVVFAGYGIREKSPARDDYRDVDARDKVVVVRDGVPPGPEWQSEELVARYASQDDDQRQAARLDAATALGARAVLVIEGNEFASRLTSAASSPAPAFFLPFDEPPSRTLPLVRVSPRVGQVLLAALGVTAGPAAAGTLPEVRATVRVTGDERLILSRNVIAVIPGSQPNLAGEAVVIGAHVDHLGQVNGRLFPGADDNASGVAAVLEIARALASTPAAKPKRTLVFAFWTGEEEGKLGSGYYTRHPLWPLDRTSVYLNLDMIGHPWTTEEMQKLVRDTGLEKGEEFLAKVAPADFIELGVADSAPQLDGVLARAARATGVALHFDRTDGKNGGSDYRDFARKGLPFVRFFGNYFGGYHEPTDTADNLDTAQVLTMTRLAFAAAWLFTER
jgi:hypothetical protein